ncbi:COQ9 family protein [Sinirhodobacter huangdaonensis]|uniref:COQ9 family protein n=1 Tax=Paenirhodobacter huangdaonensis TaxID=2501515 RepID=A0A443LR91_9RHOB|nr:COQ9 family protein [Sinirhodobacter huangdaonensis]RWR51701.1 COQ9 family protein [Sinirhodobacter huangdaonensis]
MKNDHLDVVRMRAELLAAIEPHVPFDGWSEPAFRQAVADLGADPALARLVCPRGAVDLAVAYHRAADRAMVAALTDADLSGMKFRDKVAHAVTLRLGLVDPELVRRAASLFALPQYAATGARLVWETADAIWRALGDESADYNWYSKRMTLSGVISSTVLFWLGDESEGLAETRAFLDRRIADVMQFEKVKGAVIRLPGLKGLLGAIRAPQPTPLPGHEERAQ